MERPVSYDTQQPCEARLIRLQTELERERHDAEMRINGRIHELEIKMLRNTSFMEMIAMLMAVITIIAVVAAARQ